MTDWDAIRQEFPTTSNFVYLDSANKGLLPRPSVATISGWIDDTWRNAGQVAFSAEGIEQSRAEVAALIGAEPRSLAFVKNTSEGLNIVAQGLGLKAGDNVIISRREHPANGLPWRHLERDGVEVRLITHAGPVPKVEDYLAHVDRNTRAITASWIFYGNGARLDIPLLADECRKREIFLTVDAIQAAGLLDQAFPSLGANAIVSGGHKAMLGLAGTGFVWLSDDALERLSPRFAARSSYRESDWDAQSITYADGAQRFEYGNQNQLGLAVLARSAAFIRGIGLRAVERRIHDLTDRLIAGLQASDVSLRTPLAWRDRGAIVTTDLPCSAERMSRHFHDAAIVATVRPDEVRVSLALYSNEDDVDRFIAVMTHAGT